MIYDASTPDEYLQLLENDWRKEKLLLIRKLIKDSDPDLEESIHYKMLGYGQGKSYVFHLNAQKGYVSLYVGDLSKIDPKGELTQGLNTGKSCIRVSKSKLIPDTRMDELIKRAIELWRSGSDMGG